MRTLLLLALYELASLEMKYALLADDLFALIAHLCLVELEFVTHYAVFDLVFDAE